ncbi:MAG TPA: SCO family protein [Nocardioidaceae bacterium]|nr:SCO family protein [Nocardioidaceae bacterium]
MPASTRAGTHRPGLARLALAVAVGLLVLSGCAGRASGPDRPVADVRVHDGDALAHGAVLPTPYQVPSVPLTGTDGGPHDLAEDAHRPLTLVFFGYTGCSDVCPMVMATIASALTRLDASHRRSVDMAFVTTDPARDTAKVLRSYLDRYDPRFTGLTGSLAHVRRLGTGMGVPIAHGRRLPSGGYDVSHGTQVVGMLPDGRAPFVWTAGTSPGGLADDLTAILDDEVPLS